MTCEELAQLLPELFDGTLVSSVLEEARAALALCPGCQKELEAVRQVRDLLVKLLATTVEFRPSAQFETNLYVRIRRQRYDQKLLDLSTHNITPWVILFTQNL